MNEKGFTLIELLAVIVVLAIIAIISVPIITDLINKSRYGAFGVTKKNIEHAAELYYAKNADDVYWENNIAYVTIGTLKSKKFLRNNVVNTLDSTSINDDTKVLLYRKGRKIDYSLQLYDEQFFDWYQGQMVQASKSEDITLPTNVGEIVTVDLETLMGKGLVDELRLPLELDSRCVGYVEIEKTTDNYEYNAYVDCLQGASTFASHYVSYGGKYNDVFKDVKETSDGGYIAVGESNSEEYYGNVSKGNEDAIIVKFSHDGNIEWSHNFGGSKYDTFSSVVEAPDGYVAVGQTKSSDGDVASIYRGGEGDGVIVKYDNNGNQTYKRVYGSSGSWEFFSHILLTPTGYAIYGSVNANNLNGDLVGAVTPGANLTSIILNLSFAFEEERRLFWGGSYHDEYFGAINKKNGLGQVVVGNSASNNYDMTGLNNGPNNSTEAVIVSYDENGVIESKDAFGGNSSEIFRDVVEVSDGYITVGGSGSSTHDMEGLSKASNGLRDAIIVKYDKTLTNILWKKSFGGSDVDEFMDIALVNDNEVVVVGYSKSSDMDMVDGTSGGYKDAIIVRYNTNNGNIIDKKIFGGSNSDIFYSVIKTTDNEYVISGNTFSSDINLKNFNKGHSDAILVNYDTTFNLIKSFKEPVVLIDKLKTIVPNYGTSISPKYDAIYTSNNPSTNLNGWCYSSDVYEANVNYKYGGCLYPFNTDDMKLLNKVENVNNNMYLVAGEHEYTLLKRPDRSNSWHRLYLGFGTSTGIIEISNLKLKFEDGYVGSINQAVSNGYVEPLVVVSNNSISHYFPTPLNILQTGGTTGVGAYPALFIVFKPKKSTVTSVIFTSSHNVVNAHDGFQISELRNFDMSITKTE
ncbi:MAG: prepilin-type N-terminal cleavage/methylation domain-containing protein [Bacilli bacterium]|nr:prepilin-type N-terminal cleavage/methylation domain-containing protein [Bacilli bacterium]